MILLPQSPSAGITGVRHQRVVRSKALTVAWMMVLQTSEENAQRERALEPDALGSNTVPATS